MGGKPKVPFLDLARFLRISRIKAAKTHGYSVMGIRPQGYGHQAPKRGEHHGR